MPARSSVAQPSTHPPFASVAVLVLQCHIVRETIFHTKNFKSPWFLCHAAFVSRTLLLADCWSVRRLWQYNLANTNLENTQELVAISKPGVPKRSFSAARGAKPSSTIVLVLARNMNSWEGTWHWLVLKGNCWSSLWTGSLPARRA